MIFWTLLLFYVVVVAVVLYALLKMASKID